MSSVHRRLLAGFGANTIAKIFGAAVPLVSVPVYLSHWNAGLYGDWILLNAIPSYFALSDIGFGSAASNEMTMLVAAGKQDEALSVFQSVWILSSVLSLAIAFLVVGLIWFVPVAAWLHISALSDLDTKRIIVLLALAVLFTMQETLLQGVFRCVGKYAYGTLAKSIVSSSIFALLMLFVSLGTQPVRLAVAFLVFNVCGTIVLWILLRREVGWLRMGVRHARWDTIRRLVSPAVSFMSFPIGNALSLQGVLVVIGHGLGPVAVITYNTARTISRTAIQAMELINNSVWPEISSAFGAGDISLARRLHRRSCQLSILLCITVIAGGVFFGPYLWRHWTMGKIPTDSVLLDILLTQLFFAAFWYTSSVILAATNRHQGFAKVYLASTVFALTLAWVLVQYGHRGLRSVACAMVLGEIVTSSYVLRASLRLVRDQPLEFFRSLLTPPNLGVMFRPKPMS